MLSIKSTKRAQNITRLFLILLTTIYYAQNQIRKARAKLNAQIEAHKKMLRDNEKRNTDFLYEKAKVINNAFEFTVHHVI